MNMTTGRSLKLPIKAGAGIGRARRCTALRVESDLRDSEISRRRPKTRIGKQEQTCAGKANWLARSEQRCWRVRKVLEQDVSSFLLPTSLSGSGADELDMTAQAATGL